MQKCAFKQSPIFLLKQKKIFCEIFRLALKFEMKRGKEIFWLFRSSKGAFTLAKCIAMSLAKVKWHYMALYSSYLDSRVSPEWLGQ
jgi:hypothetical protein